MEINYINSNILYTWKPLANTEQLSKRIKCVYFWMKNFDLEDLHPLQHFMKSITAC